MWTAKCVDVDISQLFSKNHGWDQPKPVFLGVREGMVVALANGFVWRIRRDKDDGLTVEKGVELPFGGLLGLHACWCCNEDAVFVCKEGKLWQYDVDEGNFWERAVLPADFDSLCYIGQEERLVMVSSAGPPKLLWSFSIVDSTWTCLGETELQGRRSALLFLEDNILCTFGQSGTHAVNISEPGKLTLVDPAPQWGGAALYRNRYMVKQVWPRAEEQPLGFWARYFLPQPCWRYYVVVNPKKELSFVEDFCIDGGHVLWLFNKGRIDFVELDDEDEDHKRRAATPVVLSPVQRTCMGAFGTLPTDVCKIIVAKVQDGQTYLKLAACCQGFRLLTEDENLWEHVCLLRGVLHRSQQSWKATFRHYFTPQEPLSALASSKNSLFGRITRAIGLKQRAGRLRSRTFLMLGLDAAGKTTLLYLLKLGEPTTTIPTIGFNLETLTYCGCTIHSWDLGGGCRIDQLWAFYYHQVTGIVYVVDANDRARFEDSYHELMRVLGQPALVNAPLAIVANKRDLSNAASAEAVAAALHCSELRRPWRIFTGCAQKGEGVFEPFDWLMQLK